MPSPPPPAPLSISPLRSLWLAVALSMACTPLLLMLRDRLADAAEPHDYACPAYKPPSKSRR